MIWHVFLIIFIHFSSLVVINVNGNLGVMTTYVKSTQLSHEKITLLLLFQYDCGTDETHIIQFV